MPLGTSRDRQCYSLQRFVCLLVVMLTSTQSVRRVCNVCGTMVLLLTRHMKQSRTPERRRTVLPRDRTICPRTSLSPSLFVAYSCRAYSRVHNRTPVFSRRCLPTFERSQTSDSTALSHVCDCMVIDFSSKTACDVAKESQFREALPSSTRRKDRCSMVSDPIQWL